MNNGSQMPYCRQSLTQLICFAVLLFSCHTGLANSHDKLPLNGIASFEMLGSEYYIASLYLQNPSTKEDDIFKSEGLKRMKLVVTQDKWRSRHFQDAWLSAININNDKNTQKSMGKEIFSFTQIAHKSLRQGDVITIDHTPGKGTQVRINDSLVLKVKDDAYFAVLLRAWIGQRPPSSDFKEYLINKNANPQQEALAERAQQTQPKNKKARYAEVASWATTISNSNKAIVAQDDKAKLLEEKRKAQVAAAQKAERKRKAEAAKQAELKRKAAAAAAAKKAKELAAAEAIKRAEAERIRLEQERIEEEKRLEQALIAEEKRLEAERKKKRGNPLRNRLREQMYKNVYNAFNQDINRIAQEKAIYPPQSIKEKQKGSVAIKMILTRDGKLKQSRVITKSPYPALNKAAEDAVKVAKFPAFPEQLNDTEDFTITIVFATN